jgi:hypothetical protein
MPGRPTIVEDEQKVAGMMGAIEAGIPITQACLHAGVSYSAHRRALEAGERAQSSADEGRELTARQEAYRAYRARVLEARAKVAVINVALVARAARGGQVIEETHRRYRDPETGQMVTETRKKYALADWRASRWLLEVSFRGDLARERMARVEATGKGAETIEVAGDDVLRSISDRLHAVQDQQARRFEGGSDGPASGATETQPADAQLSVAPGIT